MGDAAWRAHAEIVSVPPRSLLPDFRHGNESRLSTTVGHQLRRALEGSAKAADMAPASAELSKREKKRVITQTPDDDPSHTDGGFNAPGGYTFRLSAAQYCLAGRISTVKT